MGQILVDAFIKSAALLPSDIVISNRTRQKAERLAQHYPGMRVAIDNVDLVKDCDVFFICVKPLEYGHVLDQIRDATRPEQLVISITSPVMLRDIEARIPAKVAKIVPSITNLALCGASLFMYGSRLNLEDRQRLHRLFQQISRPVEVQEAHVRVSSDLASCAPAFLSFLMERLVNAAVEVTNIPRKTAESLVSEMIVGVGQLLTEAGFTLDTLQERVAVPGGVTRDGLDLLDREIGTAFNDLLQLTQQKHEKDLLHVAHMFADDCP